MPVVRVGIAVVIHEQQVLVGLRTGDVPLAGFAEFPGGKCHPGEAHRECAIRECFEETGLNVAAVELLMSLQHDYEHATVDLEFWRCHLVNQFEKTGPLNGFRWVPVAELASLTFPPANAGVVERLINSARSE